MSPTRLTNTEAATLPSREHAAGQYGEEGPVSDILVAENDDAVVGHLSAILPDAGLSCDVVDSADAVLAALNRGQYRLLLLSFLQRGLDGAGVLRQLRARPELRPAAVLILTALDQPDAVLQALEAGADDYITAPFEGADLLMRVRLWLRRVGLDLPSDPVGLSVYSLGRFYAERAGQMRLHERRRARKATTLFKYLLTNQNRPIPTGEVLDLLWPNTPEDLATTDLHSLMYQLRRLLGYSARGSSCLIHTHTTLALQLTKADWWDVARFRACLAEAAQWQRAGDTSRALEAYATGTALYMGDYLAEDAYVDWTRALREDLRADWLRALETMASLHGKLGEHEQQEDLLRTVLRGDPYRESSYRALLELLVAQGRSAEARLLYRRLCERLRADLGVPPAPATQRLIAQLLEPI
jgi:DNA-binding response OmpR family regulator